MFPIYSPPIHEVGARRKFVKDVFQKQRVILAIGIHHHNFRSIHTKRILNRFVECGSLTVSDSALDRHEIQAGKSLVSQEFGSSVSRTVISDNDDYLPIESRGYP
jgi:hypothetical protein